MPAMGKLRSSLFHPAAALCAALALGLIPAAPVRAAVVPAAPAGQAWVEDTNVTYRAPACAASKPGSDTVGDVYRPASPPAGPLPAIVLIHGGGFYKGNRNDSGDPAMAEELATLGYVTYNIDYCLADPAASPPVPGYPVEVTDVVDAVHALTTAGFDNGLVTIDPARVATWGWSAGATLAAEAGVDLTDTGATPVAAAAGWSGGYDFLDFRGATPRNEQGPLAFLGCDPMTSTSPACHDRASAASAALNVTSSTPPMTLWNSSDELVPITQWNDMRVALAQHGVAFGGKELTGKAHATQYTHTAFCPTVRFLTTYLGPETGTCVAPPNPGGSGG